MKRSLSATIRTASPCGSTGRWIERDGSARDPSGIGPTVIEDPRKRMVAEGYDALGPGYSAWASRIVDPARERLLQDFSTRLETGSKVLDLGCGTGLPNTRTLASRFQ